MAGLAYWDVSRRSVPPPVGQRVAADRERVRRLQEGVTA
jgi:hypothetical protein